MNGDQAVGLKLSGEAYDNPIGSNNNANNSSLWGIYLHVHSRSEAVAKALQERLL